jgi:hypothetical protein
MNTFYTHILDEIRDYLKQKFNSHDYPLVPPGSTDLASYLEQKLDILYEIKAHGTATETGRAGIYLTVYADVKYRYN